MASRESSTHGLSRSQAGGSSADTRQVPIQVMVPEAIRRQVALMGANRGENIRTIVLRGLQAIGINVPDSELGDRRGRRRNNGGHGNGAK
jgi:hypothetical protein